MVHCATSGHCGYSRGFSWSALELARPWNQVASTSACVSKCLGTATQAAAAMGCRDVRCVEDIGGSCTCAGSCTLEQPPLPSGLYWFWQVLQLHPSAFFTWHPVADTLHCRALGRELAQFQTSPGRLRQLTDASPSD